MTKTSTTVSICICSFNQLEYLETAIRSAAAQTFSPKQIIVSDDCSTDGSNKLLEKLSREIQNLQVFYHQKNIGIAKNTDFCLRQATGNFVVRLDSDDILLPTFTEHLLKLFNEYPLAGYAHASVQEIDESGKALNTRRLYRKTIFQSGDESLRNSVKGYKVTANIIMFRKDALMKVDYMTGRPNFGEDYHLTTALSSAGFGNIYLDSTLAQYRIWVDSGKVRQKRKLDEIIGIRRVFEDIIQPGFRLRGWGELRLAKRRSNFACQHSNCLGSKIYTLDEKLEILQEINKLSSAFKVKLYCIIYLKGLGRFVDIFSELGSIVKYQVKSVMFRLKSLTQ
jgi:glycosyltransferase involved in cell wall biosynthesis